VTAIVVMMMVVVVMVVVVVVVIVVAAVVVMMMVGMFHRHRFGGRHGLGRNGEGRQRERGSQDSGGKKRLQHGLSFRVWSLPEREGRGGYCRNLFIPASRPVFP
jgi:uncharacterized membrane protein YqiK